MKKNTILKLLLVIAIIAAVFLRIWQINKVPASLYWDEADAGYQAYSFLKTGKDYYGNSFPIFFHSFADFRTPLYIYAAVPFIAIFGNNALSVRMPSVIFGLLSVYLIYLLALKIFKDKVTAVLSSVMFLISPWSFQYSRIAFELSLMIALFLAGLYFFLRGLEKGKFLYFAVVFFGLSAWTYSTAKLFIPLFLIGLILIFWKKLAIVKKRIIFLLLIFGLVYMPLITGNFFGGGGQRFSEISIFTDPTTSKEIDLARLRKNLAEGVEKSVGLQTRFLDKVIYNKALSFLDSISSNYLKAFSPEFLFLEGDPNLRHSPKGIGQFYKIEFFALIFGVIFLAFNFRLLGNTKWLLVLWLVLAPLPSSLTRDGGNHASRLMFVLPLLIMLMAAGLNFAYKNLKGKFKIIIPAIYGLILAFEAFIFIQNYLGPYKWDSAYHFNYGFKEAVTWADSLKNNYQSVILDDSDTSLLMAYLYHNKYDPQLFQKEIKSLRKELFKEVLGNKIDNMYFLIPVSRGWYGSLQADLLKGKNLLIVSSTQLKELDPKKVEGEIGFRGKLLEVINFPDGLPAFYIIELNT